MFAVALHVIKAMKFQVAEITIYSLSYNKTDCDHLIYVLHTLFDCPNFLVLIQNGR